MSDQPIFKPTRRVLIKGLVSAGGTAMLGLHMGEVLAQGAAPAAVTSERLRPQLPGGVMSGDITADSVIVWSRTGRPARMIVEYSTDAAFKNAARRVGPAALESNGLTARVDLTGLSAGADLFYRVRFQDLVHDKVFSEPVAGRFHTVLVRANRPICFVFSGDEAGQGWGINERFDGYRLYEAVRHESPDFFTHSSGQTYADGPTQAEIKLPDGSLWTNFVTEAKSHVAQTLNNYRGTFAYNQLDKNKRAFFTEVPLLVQWDDHEVRNNWYPGQQIGPEKKRYQERSASLLAAHAKQAMFEYNPSRFNPVDPEQVYHAFRYGLLLDVFMPDERSYRGRNSPNRQIRLDADSAFLGPAQVAWFKQSFKQSKATWKVIASDMPISSVMLDLNPDVPKGTHEAWANADDGVPSGRKLELAEILRFIKQENIQNVVRATADTHYTQATYCHPLCAEFMESKPFWEFAGGSTNVSTFGPNGADQTFGPDVRYVSIPKDNPQNQSPAAPQQYYGRAKIDPATRTMPVSLHDLDGKSFWEVKLDPEA